MCTIGNAFNTSPAGIYTFKQCDLTTDTLFYDPVVTPGVGDIKYLPFMRKGDAGPRGPWAGINNYGVAFVAADAYTNDSPRVSHHSLPRPANAANDIFTQYTSIISAHKDALSAAQDMIKFYLGFDSPDILLITDKSNAYFIEYNPKLAKADRIGTCRTGDGFFCSTNHFRLLSGAVDYVNNRSTYLRLGRAEAVMQSKPNADGIVATLRDQYYGQTELSICRVADSPDHYGHTDAPPPQYHTQASVVFWTDGSVASCLYLVNGNPRTKPYTSWIDIFGKSQKTTPESAGPEVPRLM